MDGADRRGAGRDARGALRGGAGHRRHRGRQPRPLLRRRRDVRAAARPGRGGRRGRSGRRSPRGRGGRAAGRQDARRHGHPRGLRPPGAEAAIRAAGGKPSGSVSRKTDYLVAGENAGSKLAEGAGARVPTCSTRPRSCALLGGQAGVTLGACAGRGRLARRSAACRRPYLVAPAESPVPLGRRRRRRPIAAHGRTRRRCCARFRALHRRQDGRRRRRQIRLRGCGAAAPCHISLRLPSSAPASAASQAGPAAAPGILGPWPPCPAPTSRTSPISPAWASPTPS